MPKRQKSEPTGGTTSAQSDETLEDSQVHANANLSKMLKNQHAARTEALFAATDETEAFAQFFGDLEEMTSTDKNFLLAHVIMAIALLLSPARMVYRANEKLCFVAPCILYLLVVGDSGSGKSKARTIVYKALGMLCKSLEAKSPDQEEAQYSSALLARVKDLMKLLSADATSTGILETFERNKCFPPKAGMMSDELCAQLTRWASSGKQGSAAELASILQLYDGDFVSRTTGVRDVSFASPPPPPLPTPLHGSCAVHGTFVVCARCVCDYVRCAFRWYFCGVCGGHVSTHGCEAGAARTQWLMRGGEPAQMRGWMC